MHISSIRLQESKLKLGALEAAIYSYRRRVVMDAIEYAEGNVALAAAILGVSRFTVYRIVHKPELT